jgi:hypothetical protein
VVSEYRARFAKGKLGSEALGIEFRAAVKEPDPAAARRVALELQRLHPGTPQTEAATRWLKEHSQGTR